MSEIPEGDVNVNNTAASAGASNSAPPTNEALAWSSPWTNYGLYFVLSPAPQQPLPASRDTIARNRACEEFFRRQDFSEAQKVLTAEKALKDNA